MTPEEEKVMTALVEAWNAFVQLPRQHPDEMDEFRAHFHDLQRIIIARPYIRDQAR